MEIGWQSIGPVKFDEILVERFEIELWAAFLEPKKEVFFEIKKIRKMKETFKTNKEAERKRERAIAKRETLLNF